MGFDKDASADQAQPKTVSYTTDIIANGRWILPIELGEHKATKPPLYNWLAAPAVKALSELFWRARYSPRAVGSGEVGEARTHLARLAKALRRGGRS